VLAAPTPGAQLTASTNYLFGTGDLSSGRTIFKLVDDGRGGMALQWVPNLSASTLGGFTGGAIGDEGSAATTAGIARSAMGGVSGASAQIGGAAASDAMGGRCDPSRKVNGWMQFDASGTEYDNEAEGRARSVIYGAERAFSDRNGCSRHAIGIFGYGGEAETDFATGSTDGHSWGAGLFGRVSNERGLYATLTGTMGRSHADLENFIYPSEATNLSDTRSIAGVVSIARPFGENRRNGFDVRLTGSVSNIESDGFTDTIGIEVSQLDQEITSLGISAGLYQQLTDPHHWPCPGWLL
jgi:Autotransporter beta-domain